MTVKIFLCYAHEDERYLKDLKKQLSPLKREGLIDIWHDRDISAGKEWEREISERLNTAQIILLLVSPDFMNSDYCYGVEMQRALERYERDEARVIPIILRHCLWKRSPLGKLQALPEDGKPITDSCWHSQDEAFFHIAEKIEKMLEELDATTSDNQPPRFQKQFKGQRPSIYDYKEAIFDIPNTQKPNYKIVYYGISSGGITTNLHYIHQAVNPQDIGDMVSIETETEPILYFDLLPLELGKVHGFQIRFQLYMVPGLVLSRQTLTSVMKGANCVIFVADSRASKLQENIKCWNELQEQLRRISKDITTFPLIMQWNNRNSPDMLAVSVLEQYLNPYHVPSFEADAVVGMGVLECLRAAINKTLMS